MTLASAQIVYTEPHQITVVENQENVNLHCRIGQPTQLCLITMPGVANQFALSPNVESPVAGMQYYGEGLEKGSCGVQIARVTADNEGRMNCTFFADGRGLTGSIEIVVAIAPDQPVIEMLEGNLQNAEVNSKLVFQCVVARGNPAANISWFLDPSVPTCGVRKTQVNKLILGGRRVPDGKWPWHAAIAHIEGRSSEIVCGGTIIDKITILTAAHCLYKENGVIASYRVLVHVGKTDRFVTNSRSNTYRSDHFIVHPGYRQHNVSHDIALIKLGNEIEMNDFVQPVCLWPTGTDQERVVGRKGHVVGFGLHSQTHASDVLLDAEVPVVDLIECLGSNRDAFGPTLTSQMLCAGALDGVGPCNGDSGGGFFLEINNVWHIRAIVSFAPNLDECAYKRGYCVPSDQCSVRTSYWFLDRCPTLEEVCCPKRFVTMDIGTEVDDPPECTTHNEKDGYCLPVDACDQNDFIPLSSNSCVNPELICCPNGSERQTGTFATTTEFGSRESTTVWQVAESAAEQSNTDVNDIGTSFSITSTPPQEEACCPTSSVTVNIADFTRRCGVRMMLFKDRIIGGRKVPDGMWPWHAAIVHRTGRNSELVCGGSIINKLSILTAAHCLYKVNGMVAPNRVFVHVGRTHQVFPKNHSKTYRSEHFIVHPGYRQHNVSHDIALIKLESEIEMNDFVQPVCLWPTGTDHERVVGRTGYVVGFGLHNQTHMSDDLLDAEVPVVDLIECLGSNRDAFGPTLTSQMLCAGAVDGVGPCNGDSGGGFFLEINDVWYIRAIVSFAPNLYGESVCDPKQYTVYTDVLKYVEWISENQHEINEVTMDTVHRAEGILASRNEYRRNLNNIRFDINLTASNNVCSTFEQRNVTCGQRNVPCDGIDYDMIDEEYPKAKYGEFPWTVTLFSPPEAKVCCNGALIGARAILTTAHCVDLCKNSTTNVMVRVGEWDMSKPDAMPIPPENIIASRAHVHKNYNSSRYLNNIALLELEHPVRYREAVQPLCLPSADYEVSVGEHLIATGWETTSQHRSPKSQILKLINLKNEEWEMCKSYPKTRLKPSKNFICAISYHSDVKQPRGKYRFA
uniref:Peptidase S1 domain-containing protein n=1 Tax=Anopheles dirus TaxID=7168 RepID=A0A182N3G2_9DIPT